MKKLKEKILEDNQTPTSSPTYRPAPSTPSSTPSTSSSTGNPTPSHATRSNDSYVYGVSILAVLAVGVCVLFAYNTFQPKNKKQANEKKDEPPKRRHML